MPEYFVYKRQGPYGISTLSQLVQNGEVDNHSFVWTPGMASLEYAKKLPELIPWFEEQALETKKVKFETPVYAEAQPIPVPPPPVGYKVAVKGQSTGPFSLEQLVDKIQSKEISPQTLVWKPGLTQWVPAQNAEDLAEVFAARSGVAESAAAAQVPVAAEGPAEAEATEPAAALRAEPQQWEDLSRTALTEQPPSASQRPVAAAIPEEQLPTVEASSVSPVAERTHDETAELAEENPPAASGAPYSLLQESPDEGLPGKDFILPGVFILVGGVLEFLALKTAVLNPLLNKLAALFAKKPVEGEQVEELLAEGAAVVEGAAAAVPLMVKLIPGGLFVLAGIVVCVVTVLNWRSSEQYGPMQL
jgi:hypothetical protein